MRAKLFLPVFFCISLFSCQTRNLKNSPSENITAEMGDFTYSKIAAEENGSLKLLVTENSILKSAKRFSTKIGQEINPQSLSIETINGKKFLRIFNEDNTVSTVELMLDDLNIYSTGGTICKSKPNAPGEGCVPNGEYCTPTSKGTGSGEFCERTTASKGFAVGH